MKKAALIYGIAGLVIGGLFVGLVATLAVNNNNQTIMRVMGMHVETNNQGGAMANNMSMDEMTASLKGKSGDNFDEVFISAMIAHHQGAIDMANLAQISARHQEIKDLAGNIITTQSKEISQMQTWQSDWGYKTAPESHDNMGH